MADFISPWMPEHAGGRVVDLDILKGQEVMGKLSEIPSQIALREAQAKHQLAEAAKAEEAVLQSKRVQEALAKLSGGGGFEETGEAVSGQYGPAGASQWNTGVPQNPLWRMSQVLMGVDPKLSGTLANQASMIDARQIRGMKDQYRAAQIAVQTKSEQFDQVGRILGGVQTMDDLIGAAQIYEKVTGQRSGILGDDGSPPTVNIRKGGRPDGERDIEGEERLAKQEAARLAQGLMKTKDSMNASVQNARTELYRRDVENREATGAWTRDNDRRIREAREKAEIAGKKVGEKPLTSAEQKEGKAYIDSEFSFDKDRAANLGNELMDRAKRIKADPNSPKNMTLDEAKKKAFEEMRSRGRFIGAPGTGKSANSPAAMPKDAVGKSGINTEALEKNKWYNIQGRPMFWNGTTFQTPQQAAASYSRPMSATEDDDNVDTLNPVDDDNEDNEDDD